VPIEHHWAGPIDRTANSIPILGRLGGQEHIVYGVGWSGNGVAPSVLGGRILASLALGLDDEWAHAGLARDPVGLFPPEPIRHFGGRLVRSAVGRKEAAEDDGRDPDRATLLLAGLAPAGLVPLKKPVKPASV
jgi:hypothetical protein